MIYVAGPYYDKDPSVIQMRMDVIYEVMAELTKRGEVAVSPMLMHPIAVKYELPNTFEFWDKYSFELLSKCDRMIVVQMEGWNKSRGVEAEIEYCYIRGIPVEYIL